MEADRTPIGKGENMDTVTYHKGWIVDYAGYWRWFRCEARAEAFCVWAQSCYPSVCNSDCARGGGQTRRLRNRNG